jgi:3-deoxy-manno-octulosonate cytidylyltransferase (CMP-KDO synthetase)
MLTGKSMLRRCWERSAQVFPPERIWIATDDERIVGHCREGGMQVLLTPASCLTGTDRVAAAAKFIPADYYLSVQGDEPLIDPRDIAAIRVAALRDPGAILNGFCPITDPQDYENRKIPKVVFRQDRRLVYMSRSPIPGSKTPAKIQAYRQVCIYGFPPAALEVFASTGAKTPLEQLEDIEILRFLELGYEVQMIPLSTNSFSVDLPQDVLTAERLIRERGL